MGLKYNSEQIITRAKDRALHMLMHDYRKQMEARFHNIKENIEDWETAIENTDALTSRLKTIGANSSYTRQNVLDMGIICALLYNTFPNPTEPIPE